MTCAEFEELSGVYALDAVTTTERQEAADHLANCAQCRGLFQELQRAVELLPFAVSPVEPRAEVWERIASTLQPGQPKRRTNKRWWTPRLLAVAAVLMFSLLSGMAAWNVSLTQQVTSLQQQLAHMPAQEFAISGVPNNQIKGQDIRGELFYLPQQHLTVLILHGLPQVQGLQVYQGWLLHLKGKEVIGVTSIGLLNRVQETASLSFSGNVTGYDAVAVSLEPGPMATPGAPKGTIVAFGALKQAP
jgi:anti-sigma-K factor RskA